jgi:hypothetical protein
MLWEHTRKIRTEKRGEEKIMLEVSSHSRHHRHKSADNFEFVRPKRHRSKSPGLLMYLAGGRPR